MKPMVVTGAGVVSPVGVGYAAWQKVLDNAGAAAQSARGSIEITVGDHTAQADNVTVLRDFDAKAYLGPKGLRNFDRLTTFLIVAAKHALEEAGIKQEGEFTGTVDGSRIGVCISTAYGSLDAITELNRVAELEDPRYINPSRFPNTVINSAAGYVSIWEDLRGPNTTVVDGNCGALNTVMQCETHLLSDRGDVFLVGGGEVFNAPFYLALKKLNLVGEGAPLTLGEGAALLVIESRKHAAARQAQPLAEVSGYATAFEPPVSDAILVHASPVAVERAVSRAISDAGLEPKDIDVVCSAASGLEMIDKAEREGLAKVFDTLPPMASPKDLVGETHGASGAFGMLTALSWLSGAPSSPAPLSEGKAKSGRPTALVLAIGYYGNVSAVVMRR